MFIPRYWHRHEEEARTPRGETIPFSIWRGSLHSVDEARSLARDAARRMADRIRRGEGFPRDYYGERPVREPIIAEHGSRPDGTADIVITRNAYGALVLNAAQVGFIDIDPPRPGGDASLLGLVMGLFRPRPAPPDNTHEALEVLHRWLESRADWGVRVYRTKSGLRYLVTHARMEPAGGEAEAAMAALGADPQYVRLCRVQKSFRARLTPKPWRVGLAAPPVRFPTDVPDAGRWMADWQAKYDAATARHATCRLLETHGVEASDPLIRQVIALHDEHTKARTDLPLA